MSRIVVDIDELKQKLSMAEEDGCTSVILEIDGDEYTCELSVSAKSNDEEDPTEYGSIPDVEDYL